MTHQKNNKKQITSAKIFVAILCIATIFSSCKKEINYDDEDTLPPFQRPVVELSGNITGNRFLDKDTVYRLNGVVNVGIDANVNNTTPEATGILTIEAGTVIIGKKGTTGTANPGTLLIHRGSKIYAIGTASNPIVFTSAEVTKAPGDWGGLVICGKAKNNQPGGVAELEGSYGAFHGGNDDNDTSGILSYVRLEYAGFPIVQEKEINTLTFGSVGRGTQIDHIQASFGNDDAFEWFGGTVNCSHLIAFSTTDDDFDCDFGYTGNVQFAVVFRNSGLADISGSNSFEVDNDGTGTTNTPITAPTFSNVSIFGPKKDSTTTIDANFRRALHLRRSNKIKIYNSFFTGYPQGLVIDGAITKTNAENGDLIIKNSVLSLLDNWTAYLPYKSDQSGFNVSTWFNDAAKNNSTVANVTAAGFTPANLYNNTNPSFLPSTGSVLLSGASFTGLPSFFTTVTYKGAFNSTDDWTIGWTNFNPATTEYVR